MNSRAVSIVFTLNEVVNLVIRLLLKIHFTGKSRLQSDIVLKPNVVIFGTGTLVDDGRSAATRDWLRSKDFGRLSVMFLESFRNSRSV